jgi:membrane protein
MSSSLWTRGELSWRQLMWRIYGQIWEDDVLDRCGELAYVFLFSVFPLLLFLTTLLGYIAGTSSELRSSLFEFLGRVSPNREVAALLQNTLADITAARGGAKLSLSLLATLWLASNGMLGVGRSLNLACGFKETRPWWWRRLVSLVLTVAFSVLVVSGLGLIFYGGVVGEALAERLGIDHFFTLTWRFCRWPVALLFVVLSFDMVYNFAPNLKGAYARHWWTPGAVTAVGLWVAASLGYQRYLIYFKSYMTAYGSIGAVILLLIWFYLTAFSMLMGGEVNSEIAKELKRLHDKNLPERPVRRPKTDKKRQSQGPRKKV